MSGIRELTVLEESTLPLDLISFKRVTGTYRNLKYEVVEGKEIKITGFTDSYIIKKLQSSNTNVTSLTIPSYINKLPVTSIGQGAFGRNALAAIRGTNFRVYYCSQNRPIKLKINRLVLPNTLKLIMNEAFSENNIKKLVLPQSLQHLCDHCFHDNKIEELKLPNDNLYIGDKTFTKNRLRSIHLGKDASFDVRIVDRGVDVYYKGRLIKTANSIAHIVLSERSISNAIKVCKVEVIQRKNLSSYMGGLTFNRGQELYLVSESSPEMGILYAYGETLKEAFADLKVEKSKLSKDPNFKLNTICNY